MTGTHLTGLEGTNPLAFLAALGVQVLYEQEEEQPRLWWSDDVVPHAVIDSQYTVEQVADQAMRVFPRWLESGAISPELTAKDDAKFRREDMVRYLTAARQHGPGDALASCLIAEGSLTVKDGKDVAKPSDFYFTAARQLFLKMMRDILKGVTRDDVLNALNGPWAYKSHLPTMMWDVADDRLYALSASDPAKSSPNPKLTNPGVESLAILGLSCHPVFARRGRTLTLGCSGGWGRGGAYTWPLWAKPAGKGAVRSLLAQATHNDPLSEDGRKRACHYMTWGITRVLQSKIDRSSKGQGFGMFRPPETVWSRE